MLTEIHPKLPMRSKAATKEYYINNLGFETVGNADYPDYLMIRKDGIQIHFFEFKELDPKENYGQVYIRTNDIDKFYQSYERRKFRYILQDPFCPSHGDKRSFHCSIQTTICSLSDKVPELSMTSGFNLP